MRRQGGVFQTPLREEIAPIADKPQLFPGNRIQRRAEGREINRCRVRKNRQDGAVKVLARMQEKGVCLTGFAVDIDPW